MSETKLPALDGEVWRGDVDTEGDGNVCPCSIAIEGSRPFARFWTGKRWLLAYLEIRGRIFAAWALHERDRAEKAEPEVLRAERLEKALREVLAVCQDRQAFIMQGPRAFARAEQIAKRALGVP